jgi:hypothetical protein
MKLRQPTHTPDLVVRLRIPGEVAQRLERYRAYQTDTTRVAWELKDLITAMLRSFLDEGDRDFLAWCKAHDTAPATPPPATRTGNGDMPPRRAAQE